jgi:hypothetical protein
MKKTVSRIQVVGITLLLLAVVLPNLAAGANFRLKDTQGKHLDVLLNGNTVARYMYAYDKSTKDTLHETYKPYLHVYDPTGQRPITKGAGGKYTHHRGIFIGWNKMQFQGQSYDRWHMKGGEQIHQRFLNQKAGKSGASFTSLVHWNDSEGKPILEEQRSMTFKSAPSPAYVFIEFSTQLKAVRGDIDLDGDPEHAGVQFRPANEVVIDETIYVFPQAQADPKKDRDYTWVGETFTLDNRHFSVIHLNHPSNPKDTIYSAYRNYGRFGAFFKHNMKAGQILMLRYGFLIREGEMFDAATIQTQWDSFAGRTTPSAVPTLTVTGGVQKGKKK